MPKTATVIECVLQPSQAADGADAMQLAAHLVMGNLGDDDDRATCPDGLHPAETTPDLRPAWTGRTHGRTIRPVRRGIDFK